MDSREKKQVASEKAVDDVVQRIRREAGEYLKHGLWGQVVVTLRFADHGVVGWDIEPKETHKVG